MIMIYKAHVDMVMFIFTIRSAYCPPRISSPHQPEIPYEPAVARYLPPVLVLYTGQEIVCVVPDSRKSGVVLMCDRSHSKRLQ